MMADGGVKSVWIDFNGAVGGGTLNVGALYLQVSAFVSVLSMCAQAWPASVQQVAH